MGDYFTARSGGSTTRSQLSSTRSGERHAGRERGSFPSSSAAPGNNTAASTGAGDNVSGALKRAPKRAPKPPQPQEPRELVQEVVTIFTRPETVASGTSIA